MQETWVLSLAQENPLEKETAAPSSILAWRAAVRGVAEWDATEHARTIFDNVDVRLFV